LQNNSNAKDDAKFESNKFLEREEKYRDEYSRKISELRSLLILLPLYFENFDDEKINEYTREINQGFGFDFELLAEEYKNLVLINTEGKVILDKLETRFDNKYESMQSKRFNLSTEIINEMYKEIK